MTSFALILAYLGCLSLEAMLSMLLLLITAASLWLISHKVIYTSLGRDYYNNTYIIKLQNSFGQNSIMVLALRNTLSGVLLISSLILLLVNIKNDTTPAQSYIKHFNNFSTQVSNGSNSNKPNNTIFNILAKIIGIIIFLILVYFLFYFLYNEVYPIYVSKILPIISPYLIYMRYLGIIYLSISLYNQVKNWNSNSSIKPDNNNKDYSEDETIYLQPNQHINELGLIETDYYRWWVNPLKIVISLMLILWGIFYFDYVIYLFKHHLIITSLLLFAIIAFLLLFSDELLNMSPVPVPKKYQPRAYTFSDYSKKLGPFMDKFADSKWDKLINVIINLNLLTFLCFLDLLINQNSIYISLLILLIYTIFIFSTVYIAIKWVFFIYFYILVKFHKDKNTDRGIKYIKKSLTNKKFTINSSKRKLSTSAFKGDLTINKLNKIKTTSNVKNDAAQPQFNIKYFNNFSTQISNVPNSNKPSNKFWNILVKIMCVIVFLILVYLLFYFYNQELFPYYVSNIHPVINPYLIYFRYLGIMILSINLYLIIVNWNDNTSIESNNENKHYNENKNKAIRSDEEINELWVLEFSNHYRWWIDLLRVITLFSLIGLSYYNFDYVVYLFKQHFIIISLLYIFILGFLLIFDNEFFNMIEMERLLSNENKHVSKHKYSDYSNRLGPFMDKFDNSKYEKIIHFIIRFNLLTYLCLMNVLADTDNIFVSVLISLIATIFALSTIYLSFELIINFYFSILKIFNFKNKQTNNMPNNSSDSMSKIKDHSNFKDIVTFICSMLIATLLIVIIINNLDVFRPIIQVNDGYLVEIQWVRYSILVILPLQIVIIMAKWIKSTSNSNITNIDNTPEYGSFTMVEKPIDINDDSNDSWWYPWARWIVLITISTIAYFFFDIIYYFYYNYFYLFLPLVLFLVLYFFAFNARGIRRYRSLVIEESSPRFIKQVEDKPLFPLIKLMGPFCLLIYLINPHLFVHNQFGIMLGYLLWTIIMIYYSVAFYAVVYKYFSWAINFKFKSVEHKNNFDNKNKK